VAGSLRPKAPVVLGGVGDPVLGRIEHHQQTCKNLSAQLGRRSADPQAAGNSARAQQTASSPFFPFRWILLGFRPVWLRHRPAPAGRGFWSIRSRVNRYGAMMAQKPMANAGGMARNSRDRLRHGSRRPSVSPPPRPPQLPAAAANDPFGPIRVPSGVRGRTRRADAAQGQLEALSTRRHLASAPISRPQAGQQAASAQSPFPTGGSSARPLRAQLLAAAGTVGQPRASR